MSGPKINKLTPKIVKSDTSKLPQTPMYDHAMVIKKPVKLKLSEDFKNLSGTAAGNEALKMAQQSNRQYGTEPGYITAEVWNPYAEAHGGKKISGTISVKDAMNSITTYTIREQTEAKRAEQEELQANSETGQRPEQGI